MEWVKEIAETGIKYAQQREDLDSAHERSIFAQGWCEGFAACLIAEMSRRDEVTANDDFEVLIRRAARKVLREDRHIDEAAA